VVAAMQSSRADARAKLLIAVERAETEVVGLRVAAASNAADLGDSAAGGGECGAGRQGVRVIGGCAGAQDNGLPLCKWLACCSPGVPRRFLSRAFMLYTVSIV
jgi:hypothetical protein